MRIWHTPMGSLPSGGKDMLKTLYSRHNEVLLDLLRSSRRAMRLRQSDLALRLGRDQATVSRVERGVRRLDVIELRTWLEAMGVDFITFVQSLDSKLRGAGAPKRARGSRPAGRR